MSFRVQFRLRYAAVMTRTSDRQTLLLASLIGITALTGCTATGSTGPDTSSPSAAATASPSATSAPAPSATADAAVADILVTAEAVELRDSAGAVVASLDYFESATEAREELTQAFGAEPTSEDYRSNHAAGTMYSWDGFYLADTTLPPTNAPYEPDYWVRVTSPTVNGVHVHTLDGIEPGDPAPELEAKYRDSSTRVKVDGKPERLDVFVGSIELPPRDGSAPGDLTLSVMISAQDPAGTVTDFRAPSANFGA